MENGFASVMIDNKEGIMKGFIKVIGLVLTVLFAWRCKFFVAYYGTLLGLNIWPKVAMLGLVAVVVAGICQYSRQGKRRYNERMFVFISAVFSAITAAALFVEGCDSIIAYLDHTLAATDSPAWSVIIAPWVALFAGALMCLVLMYLGAIIGEVKRQAVIKKQKAERKVATH